MGVLSTDDPALPRWALRANFSSNCTDEYLAGDIQMYLQHLCTQFGLSLDRFDLTEVERYLSPYRMSRRSVYPSTPMNPGRSYAYDALPHALPYLKGTFDDAPIKVEEPEPPFEVNMMECLIGWKGWKVQDGLLHSPSYEAVWQPDVAFEAKCRINLYGGEGQLGTCETPVRERHTCGIYATTKLSGAKGYGVVRGQVYGWGRYVRGDSGWRSQFAYPKSFHLTSDQIELIEPLRKYHVEIFIDQPLRIYDPQEEGYGHGEDAAYGNCGAAEGAAANEARGACGESAGDEED